MMSVDLEVFATRMRDRESSGDYEAVNQWGYLGAYQFGLARLCDLGFTRRRAGARGWGNKAFEWRDGYSRSQFLLDHDLQDETFRRHVRRLIRTITRYGLLDCVGDPLSDYLDDYDGDCIVTLSGMVAVAHLLGPGGLRDTMQGRARADGLGTTAAEYMEHFAGIF